MEQTIIDQEESNDVQGTEVGAIEIASFEERGATTAEEAMSLVDDDQAETIGDASRDDEIEAFKAETNWFVCAADLEGERQLFDREALGTAFRQAILDGTYQKDSAVVIYAKGADAKWVNADATVEELAKHNFKLRVLFKPMWSHVSAGLKWGAICGAAIKILDTFLVLLAVNSGVAILFAAAVAVCVIPRIGWMGFAAVIYFSMKYTAVNVFIMGVSAGLVGAALGLLPGMAIGGVIGLAKRRSLPAAPGAAAESPTAVLFASFAALVAGIALLLAYVFVFNPWLVTVLVG